MSLWSTFKSKSLTSFSGAFLGLAAASLITLSAWAVSITVGEMLIKGASTEAKNQLVKLGLKDSQKLVFDSFELSLKAMGNGGKPASVEALRSLIGNDKAMVAILDKGLDKVSKQEVAALHDFLAQKANRLQIGSRFVGTDACVDPEALAFGIKILARSVDAKSSKLLSSAPTGAELGKAILNKSKALATRKSNKIVLKGIDSASLAALSDAEQQALYVAIEKASVAGSPEEKLMKAIQAFNGDNITQPKLWMVFSEEMDAANMERLGSVLAGISNKDKTQRVADLRDWFERSVDTPELKESLENLKRRNCWGLFNR